MVRPIHCDNHASADYECEACLERFRFKAPTVKPQQAHLFTWYTELRDQPCTDCGGRYPIEAMEFDHVPGRGKKLFEIGSQSRGPMSKKVKDELAKCDLVCANCHRIRTHARGYKSKWAPWPT